MKQRGASLVLLATMGLALKGIWARLAYGAGLSVTDVLFFRCALSAPLVVFTAWWLLRGEDRSQLRPRDYLPGVLLGAMFSLGMTSDFHSIDALGASVSRVVLFGYPAVVLALNAAESKRLPSPTKVLGFAASWLGLLAVVSPGIGERASAPFGDRGLAWGAASLTLYALYVWLSGKAVHKLGSVRLTSISNLSTAAVVMCVVPLTSGADAGLPSATLTGIGWVGLMVLVSTVVPYFLMMEGIRKMGSSDASLLSMSGPVMTVAAGWLVLGERLTTLQMAGTALTLLGVAWTQGRLVPSPPWRPFRAPAAAATDGDLSESRA